MRVLGNLLRQQDVILAHRMMLRIRQPVHLWRVSILLSGVIGVAMRGSR